MHPGLREVMMFDSPYPPMPQREAPSAPLPPLIHEDQLHWQSRTVEKSATPRRATTGAVPPQVLAARRNVSGPASSGGSQPDRKRTLVFSGPPIDTAAAKAGPKTKGGDSSEDDPISAEILDNASVPMFVPLRISSLVNSGTSSSRQSVSRRQPSSTYTSHSRTAFSASCKVRINPVERPPSPCYGSIGNLPPEHHSLGLQPSQGPFSGLSHSQNSSMESPSNGHSSSEPSLPECSYHRLSSPVGMYSGPPLSGQLSSPPKQLPATPITQLLYKEIPDFPPGFLIEFPKAATTFANAIQEAERRLHKAVPEYERVDTDPEGMAYFRILDGMFDEIKDLSICRHANNESDTFWPFASKLSRQRLSILKGIPSEAAPERSKDKRRSKETSPVLSTFARPRKNSTSTVTSKKSSGSFFWKKTTASTPPSGSRFSLDQEADRVKERDSVMVEFVWSLKSSCPVTKNVTQYGEWERMAGEDGRTSAYSLLKPEDKWMLNQLRAQMEKQ